MKSEIINHLTWLTNKLAEVNTYTGWHMEYRLKELELGFETFYTSLSQNKHIDFENITLEEAQELRFGRWEGDLYLFPLWLVPLIPEGLEVTDINNNTFKYTKENADNDIRYGCVAYGINIKK